MDLVLWRHADAEDGTPDLARRLTPNGRNQAERAALWLRRSLPPGFEIVSSPARRAQETAQALGMPFAIAPALAPGATVSAILETAGWPMRPGCIVLVGHQPDFGRTAALLMCGAEQDWHVKKAGLWWIAHGKSAFVRAVLSPDLL
jgi:phosphohistidine phosphatase